MRLLERPDPVFTRGCVLVPTMGALHAGHAELVRLARARADRRAARVVVTVFVNPTQFNESADFDRYPRTLDADLRACADAGADAVLAPAPDTVYPPGRPIPVPDLPGVATEPGLEDAFRPGHFAGVCQVVSRLFDLTEPAAGVFGEKDWQQLQVIRAMTLAQGRPIDIVPAPTVREPDGLAMSSRNRLLSPEARAAAPAIPRAIRRAAACDRPEPAERALTDELTAGGIAPEYAVVRDAETLLAPCGRSCRVLVAARVGGVRLIDNAPWPGPSEAPAT
ncbi:MAG: pantoate--beta-alanine ligase [Phycisphaerales bacterium]|nr:pantoate--beta-alanine ligase [Phycisphaerales bacterium]